MSFRTIIIVLIGAACISTTLKTTFASEDQSSDPLSPTLACFFEENAIDCAVKRIDEQLDAVQKSGQNDPREPPMTLVIQETKDVVAQGVDAVGELLGSGEGDREDIEEEKDDDTNGESRKKKLGKKKKKALQKILMVAMVLKAKLSLLLQLLSTHLQIKFFAIATISLLLNIVKFWIDIKKGGHPQKVIYYEHAQHQHHYEPEIEEHPGYWGRSSDDAQELAYGAYPELSSKPY
ncbi:uncharacterized protein LOC125500938 [Athalia rosae]|uniref:uncharacterized protein LOC125500938 n=1 Tax=Athalia rosae TaxID=37344 RepID=UPI002034717E|nr:uncharacterized protein LOC125500938 [Athalia rosae]